jgi:hypothetical protein
MVTKGCLAMRRQASASSGVAVIGWSEAVETECIGDS